MEREIIIKAEGVNFAYETEDGQVEAVRNVTLDVFKGEFLAILGHNGCGKSTLAKLFNAFLPPKSGTVTVNGVDTADEKRLFDIRSKIGMVFQNPDNQTVASIVEDDIAFGPENLAVPREEIIRRVTWALTAVNMLSYRNSSAHKLSGGQKQRVAIAAVLAMLPDILVLDESTSMLDPEGRKEVLETVRKLNKDGMTVVLITHYMDEAIFADRAVVMKDGEIIAIGTPEEIFSSDEVIKKSKLSPPAPTRISKRLQDAGFDIKTCLTDEDLVRDFHRLICGDNALRETPLRVTYPSVCAPQSSRAPFLTANSLNEKAIISVNGLNFTYGAKTPFEKKALKNINFSIGEGESVGIVGATGSGKSTLIQHLNGLIKLKDGQISVFDIDLNSRKPNLKLLRQGIGMLFQYPEYQLFAETVLEDVMFGPLNFGFSKEEAKLAAEEAVRLVGLDESVLKKSPLELSGGQKRRVAIAGALAYHPQVLILDEPTAGLDPLGKTEILELVKSLRMSGAVKTVITVSHNMDEIARYADRVLVLKDGEIYCDCTPATFFYEKNPYELSLELPHAVNINKLLKQKGIVLAQNILDADELAEELIRTLKAKGVS